MPFFFQVGQKDTFTHILDLPPVSHLTPLSFCFSDTSHLSIEFCEVKFSRPSHINCLHLQFGSTLSLGPVHHNTYVFIFELCFFYTSVNKTWFLYISSLTRKIRLLNVTSEHHSCSLFPFLSCLTSMTSSCLYLCLLQIKTDYSL